MKDIEYQTEFIWEIEKKLVSLLLVTNPKSDDDLLLLSDRLYEKYIKDFDEVMFHFFRNTDSVTDYVYYGMVNKEDESAALRKSGCIAHLIKNNLTALGNKNRCIKNYDNPRLND